MSATSQNRTKKTFTALFLAVQLGTAGSVLAEGTGMAAGQECPVAGSGNSRTMNFEQGGAAMNSPVMQPGASFAGGTDPGMMSSCNPDIPGSCNQGGGFQGGGSQGGNSGFLGRMLSVIFDAIGRAGQAIATAFGGRSDKNARVARDVGMALTAASGSLAADAGMMGDAYDSGMDSYGDSDEMDSDEMDSDEMDTDEMDSDSASEAMTSAEERPESDPDAGGGIGLDDEADATATEGSFSNS